MILRNGKQKRTVLRENEMTKLMKEARSTDFRDKEINVDVASEQLVLRMLEDQITRFNTDVKELVASPLY